jgi:hypothetical protein
MKKLIIPVSAVLFGAVIFFSCKKNNDGSNNSVAKIIFKLKLDSSQIRLNNIGQPAIIATGRAAQSPRFNGISAHYIEFAPNAFTTLGAGAILYHAPEVTTGGSTAIDFSKAIIKKDGEVFLSVPSNTFAKGDYSYIRLSLSYQNYAIDYKFNSGMQIGTVASFIGYNTYINSFTINTTSLNVNANKAQGFWAFETMGTNTSGQAPAGATTVPNPIFATSPIPQGSCVVTAAFVDTSGVAMPLKITGSETKDIVVTLSLSTNKSFEWMDLNGDGLYEPLAGETVVDMGIRGLKPIFVK